MSDEKIENLDTEEDRDPFDEDAPVEDLIEDVDGDELFEDDSELEDDDDDGFSEDDKAENPNSETTNADGDDEPDPDDVEADLTAILQDRITAEDDEVSENSPAARKEAGNEEKVVAKQEDEIHCPSCFLLVSQAAVDKNGECPHCGALIQDETSAMFESARFATQEDIDTFTFLHAMSRSLIAEHRGGDYWLVKEALQNSGESLFTEVQQSETSVCIMGLYDDYPVGFLIGEIYDLLDATAVDICEVFVEPDARAVGVGETMMDSLTDWARTQSATYLTSRALPGDRALKNFFERYRITARLIEVARKL